MEQAPIFDEIYDQYITDVANIDLSLIRSRLGIEIDGDTAIVPFYGIPYRISGEGITDPKERRPIHAVSVILCKYLLLCPKEEPPAKVEWIKYHSFKDAAPFAGGFLNTAEKPIGKAFCGRLDDLANASRTLGGVPADTPIQCDLAVRFPALPKVNLLLLFNDEDDEFPADCSLLYEKHADAYLDMECLAMLGMVLAAWLQNGSDYRDGNV